MSWGSGTSRGPASTWCLVAGLGHLLQGPRELLASNDPSTAEKGAAGTSGVPRVRRALGGAHVQETLEGVKKSAVAQSEHFQAELALITSRATSSENGPGLKEKLGAVRKESSRFEKWISGALEGFVDAGNAVRRRKTFQTGSKRPASADRISSGARGPRAPEPEQAPEGRLAARARAPDEEPAMAGNPMIIGRTGK